MILPGYTWQCGIKDTDVKLQTLQDEELILTLQNVSRSGVSSFMGDRYLKSDVNKKIFYIDSKNIYGWAMKESLSYDEIEMWKGHNNFYMDRLKKKNQKVPLILTLVVSVRLI